MLQWMLILRIWPKVTSHDENAENTARFCVKVPEMSTTELDRTGSGLKLILAGSGLDRTAIYLKIDGSGLDRTEKIFVVLMWLFWTYQKHFSCDPISQVC